MRGVYVVTFRTTGAAITAAVPLLLVTPPSNTLLELLGAAVTNISSINNQQLECCLQRQNGGAPVGTASPPSPTPTEPGDQADSSTVLWLLTTPPTWDAQKVFGDQGWQVQGGWFYDPVPEERVVVSPANGIGLRLLSTPSPAIDVAVELVYRKIG